MAMLAGCVPEAGPGATGASSRRRSANGPVSGSARTARSSSFRKTHTHSLTPSPSRPAGRPFWLHGLFVQRIDDVPMPALHHVAFDLEAGGQLARCFGKIGRQDGEVLDGFI